MNLFSKFFDTADPLIELTKICGIAGLSIGFVFLLFKQIISEWLFAKFTKVQAYKIIRLIILCSFSLALTGIIVYTIIKVFPKPEKIQTSKTYDTLIYQPLKLIRKGKIIIDSTKKKK